MFHHYSVRPFVTLCRRALYGCLLLLLTVPAAMGDTQPPAAAYPQRHGDLTPREQAMAVKAWQYFVTNYQPATGLVNAVNNYPSTTMWDSASYLAALTAARELGIIDKEQFDQRLIKFLATLNTVPLFQNQMPNKAYNTITAQKVDYLNKPGEIGFSSIDIGRMLLWLKIIKERYPDLPTTSITSCCVGISAISSTTAARCMAPIWMPINSRFMSRKAGWAMRNTPPAVSSCGVLHLPGLPRGALPVGGHLLCSGAV